MPACAKSYGMVKEGKMPNIELHGFGNEKSHAAIEMRDRVFDLFSGKRGSILKKDVVVTTVSDRVQDCTETEQPFIRLLMPFGDDFSFVISRLKILRVDVEVLPLQYFYPKK